MADNNVVPKARPQTEEKFHAEMMVAITRLIASHGKDEVAAKLDISTRHIGNLAKGSFPAPHRLWNLLALDPDALDPIDRLYESRRVPRNAVCSTDPVSTKLAKLLTRTIEAEHPDSPGGPAVTLSEIIQFDEGDLRAAARALTAWVELLDAYRAGEAPKLRAVGE